jgi:prolyl-tRNA synthetase
LNFQTAIEVGHIFKLGTKYSEPLGARVLDEDGNERTIVMGSYGIGLGRIMAAAIEQHHDENGIIWPRELAPYDVHVVALPGAEAIADQAAEALSDAGFDVLLDDRDMRAGEKFADADLIGCPIRITAGKKSLEDGKVDVKDRATGEEQRLAVADLGKER